LDDKIELRLKEVALEFFSEIGMSGTFPIFLDLVIEHISIEVECKLPFEYPMMKLGFDKKEEAFVDDWFHFYKKSYLVIDDIKVFESTKHIKHKV